MNKRLFRSTSFGIVVPLGICLAVLAGAQEPEAPALVRAGWSLAAQQVRAVDQDQLQLTGDVRLRRGAWRISAQTADVTGDAIALRGDVRIAGPRVYVMSDSAAVLDETVEVLRGSILSDRLQFDADGIVVSTSDSTVGLARIGDVDDEPHRTPRGAASAP